MTKTLLFSLTARTAQKLSEIDPDRVSVEDVSKLFFFCPKWFSKIILNTAVRRGEFIKSGDFYSLVKKSA